MNSKKSLLSCFIATILLVVCVTLLPVDAQAAETIANGTCGKNLTWVLDDAGTLTISGTGTMKDYILGSPWEEYRDSILQVVITDGVTSIGDYAFHNCPNLTTVTMANTVTSIGWSAFDICENLSSINIPSSVTKIEAGAFCWVGIKSVYIDDLTAWMNINFEDEYANPLCWGKSSLYLNGSLLTDVTIPEGITVLSPAILSSEGLERVVIPRGVTTIGARAFSYCTNLKSITIPDSVTAIGEYAFLSCENLSEIILPNSVTSLGSYVFSSCESLQSITIPSSITSIPQYAFLGCDNLTDIYIPNSVTSIGDSAFCQCDGLKNTPSLGSITSISKGMFQYCDKLSTVVIPNGVTSIGESAFNLCFALSKITIPSSVTHIGKDAFPSLSSWDHVYFEGTQAQWETLVKNNSESIKPLLDAEVHIAGNPLVVYSDANNLNVEIGKTITLSAGMWVDAETMGDPSGITFQLADGYVVKIVDTGIENGCFYLQLEGVMCGTTYVTFTDSTTARAVTVPVTVVNAQPDVYTLESVPEFKVYNGLFMEGPLNFYNENGLYVDSFHANVTDNGKAFVSFDVYNTNHTYAVVEVYDENGDICSAALIDKMSYLNDGIKKVLWDGTGCVVRDVFSGNALTYKQETNFSQRTPVEVEIPKNGYIRITANSMESDILAIVNAADIVMASYSLAKDAGNLNRLDFAKDLTEQLVIEDYLITSSINDRLAKEVLKGYHKEVFLNSKTAGDFASTLYNNLQELNLIDLILKSADKTAVGVVEAELKAVLGVYGDALDIVFTIGKAENLICQYMSLTGTETGGVVIIQNQLGGKRHCDNIVLESEVDFDPEVALQVYSVALDEALLEKIKNASLETYEILTKSILHTYNISLVKNGEETQHSSDVAVHIPIPDDLEYLGLSGHLKVYRIEEDGALTDMDAVVQGDTVMFTTDHFSLYTLVGYGVEDQPETDPSEPTTPETTPAEKDEPSDSKGGTDEPSNKGGIVWIIVAVVVVLTAGGVVAFILIKKKQS